MLYYIRRTISRALSPQHKLRCTTRTWNELLRQLHIRGGNQRESGAYLLGGIDPDGRRRISCIAYYDDLDPNALSLGHIKLDRRRLGSLWSECRRHQLDVIADVHTHPGRAIQSSSDRANPMLPELGHLAIIIPNYARPPVHKKDVGIFEYQGRQRWLALSTEESSLYLAPWA